MFPAWIRPSELGWTPLLTHYFRLAEQTTDSLTFNCTAATTAGTIYCRAAAKTLSMTKTAVTNMDCNLLLHM